MSGLQNIKDIEALYNSSSNSSITQNPITQNRQDPSFFFTKMTGLENGLEGLIITTANISLMSLWISSF